MIVTTIVSFEKRGGHGREATLNIEIESIDPRDPFNESVYEALTSVMPNTVIDPKAWKLVGVRLAS